MYKIAFSLFLTVLLLTTVNTQAQDTDPNMGIIPAPVSVKKSTGEFVLSQQTVLLADTASKAVAFFTDYLRNKLNLRCQLKIGDSESTANSIVFTSKGTDNLPDQG